MASAAREVARLLGFRGPSGTADQLAAMSKRVLRWSLLLTALGGAAALAWSPGAAVALTVAGLVSSFSFRGLEMQVRALEPNVDGRAGARNTLFTVLRYSLLSAFIVAALLVGSREFIALILGFSVVPLALVASELARRVGSPR
ncbi:MAG: hypothetical protein OXI49_14555 [Acidobacteriota bacterium]|nr:hypothetical protein [Acidobacteriota bacterium]